MIEVRTFDFPLASRLAGRTTFNHRDSQRDSFQGWAARFRYVSNPECANPNLPSLGSFRRAQKVAADCAHSFGGQTVEPSGRRGCLRTPAPANSFAQLAVSASTAVSREPFTTGRITFTGPISSQPASVGGIETDEPDPARLGQTHTFQPSPRCSVNVLSQKRRERVAPAARIVQHDRFRWLATLTLAAKAREVPVHGRRPTGSSSASTRGESKALPLVARQHRDSAIANGQTTLHINGGSIRTRSAIATHPVEPPSISKKSVCALLASLRKFRDLRSGE